MSHPTAQKCALGLKAPKLSPSPDLLRGSMGRRLNVRLPCSPAVAESSSFPVQAPAAATTMAQETGCCSGLSGRRTWEGHRGWAPKRSHNVVTAEGGDSRRRWHWGTLTLTYFTRPTPRGMPGVLSAVSATKAGSCRVGEAVPASTVVVSLRPGLTRHLPDAAVDAQGHGFPSEGVEEGPRVKPALVLQPCGDTHSGRCGDTQGQQRPRQQHVPYRRTPRPRSLCLSMGTWPSADWGTAGPPWRPLPWRQTVSLKRGVSSTPFKRGVWGGHITSAP